MAAGSLTPVSKAITSNTSRRGLPWFIILGLIWSLVPLAVDRDTLSLLAVASIYTIVALGVAVLLGQCGIVSLAQAAFYGIGAFGSTYVTVRMGWPIWSGFLVGVVLAGVIALVLGAGVLRLAGYYLALGTLALGSIAALLFGQWDSITGGTLGVGGAPEINVGPVDFSEPLPFYYLGWVLAVLLMLMAHNLMQSRHGLAMRAMRDQPSAAEVLGVDIARLRMNVFILSALLGAVGGSLYAHYRGFVNMSSFGVDQALLLILMAVLGGTHRVWGVAIGAILVTVLPEWLTGLGAFHQVLFGLIMVAVIVLLPGGAVDLVARLRRRPT